MASNQPENAIKAFLLGGQWAKAKKVGLKAIHSRLHRYCIYLQYPSNITTVS